MTSSQHDNQSFYDRDASTYNATRFVDASGRREHEQLRNMLEVELVATAPKNVLEIGSGAGRVSKILQQHCDSLTLLDLSSAMLAQAQSTCVGEDPAAQISSVNGSILDLPLRADSFDMVVCINVLTHISDYRAALSELERVLVPGGTAIFSTTRLDSVYLPGALCSRLTGRAVGYDVPSFWPSNRYVIRSLEGAGLVLRQVGVMYHVPRRIRHFPGMESVISRADRFARTNKMVGRLAPWVLWISRKP